MSIQPVNFVKTTLRAPVGVSDTQLQLAAGTGVLFNSVTTGNYVYVVVNDQTTVEVMKYTSSGTVLNDTIIVTRAQDNTSAKAFPTGSCVAIQWNLAQVREYIIQVVMEVYGTVILPPTVQVITTVPTLAPTGSIIWTINTTDYTLYYWTGSAWMQVSAGYYQEINTRQYNDNTGVALAKGTDNIVGGLTGMVNLGVIPFPVVVNYRSNTAVTSRIVIPTSGLQINELLFPHAVACRFNACFVGDRPDSSVPVHAALTIFHAADSLEWQQSVFVPGDDADNPLNRNVSCSVTTDALVVVPTDYFDLNLTVYDSGAAYGGFTLKQLCFSAQVSAIGSI